MTLCNVCLTADRAVMLTDTLAGTTTTPICFTSKFEIMAHITAMFSARGPDDFRHETRLFLDHAHLPNGIESAVQILPAFLIGLEASLPTKYLPGKLVGEIIMVGWSPPKGRFAGYILNFQNAYQPRELELNHTHYLPAGPDYRPIPHVDFGAKLIALAKKQHEVMVAETQPGKCPTVGGDLISCSLTKSGVEIKKVARLPGYDQLREQINDRSCSTPRDPSRNGEDRNRDSVQEHPIEHEKACHQVAV